MLLITRYARKNMLPSSQGGVSAKRERARSLSTTTHNSSQRVLILEEGRHMAACSLQFIKLRCDNRRSVKFLVVNFCFRRICELRRPSFIAPINHTHCSRRANSFTAARARQGRIDLGAGNLQLSPSEVVFIALHQ